MANAFQFMATAFYILCGSVCLFLAVCTAIGTIKAIAQQIKGKHDKDK